jgi:hypothetical protein
MSFKPTIELPEQEFHERIEPELMEYMAMREDAKPENIKAGIEAYSRTIYRALHSPETEDEGWLAKCILSLLTTLRDRKLEKDAAPLMDFWRSPLSDAQKDSVIGRKKPKNNT